MEKIIFLDIDGVLCVYPEIQQDWVSNTNSTLTDYCCRNLKAALDSTGAKLVITSSWRLREKDLDDLIWQLDWQGISKDNIVGQTADLSSNEKIKSHNELRWLEIKDYIDKHQIKEYVILDDFNLEKHDKQHLVRTKKHDGLTLKLTGVVINKLRKIEK